MTDILIVGAGCAGLTAAIYAIRAGFRVRLLEKYFYGGQIAITNEVENYPGYEKISGPELSMKIYEQAQKLGADVRFEEAVSADLGGGVKTVTTAQETYEARCVIVANGVKRRTLDCPGEEAFTGRGVSYCATCDGAFFKGKDVAVIGGGNTALEDALFLSNLCSQVHLIHRRDTFRGEPYLAKAVKSRENIVIHYDSAVTEITGEQSVTGLTIKQLKTGEAGSLSLSAVFIAIGLIPDNEIFSQLPRDEAGYLLADETCKTPIGGVFVAGDTRQKELRQIITAAADGAVAGYQAANYLNAHEDSSGAPAFGAGAGKENQTTDGRNAQNGGGGTGLTNGGGAGGSRKEAETEFWSAD